MVKPARASVDSSSFSSNNDSFSSNKNIDSCKMFKGVRLRKWGKWVSEIRLPNSRERIWLGSYDTQVKAARAFDAALYCLRGKTATFNFPDTPRRLEINNVVLSRDKRHPLTHSEIQEIAAKFAVEVEEEEEESGFQQEEPSLESNNNNNSNNTMREMSNLPNIYDIGETHNVQQGDWETMDWTFFNMLDDINASDKLHLGEFLYPITQVPLFFHGDHQIEGDDDHDAFSNHSFLWNWNF